MKVFKILSLFMVMALAVALFTGCTNNNDTPSISGSQTPPPAEANTPTAGSAELSYEEGTSEADGIVNTTAAEKVILVVSFGTSFNQSRALTIGGIETAVKNAYPEYQVRRAFTSQIIIDKLAARDNLTIDNVTEAMNRLVLDKVKEVVIQPTTVMNGFEYDDAIAEIMPFADKFESLKIGKWLLADDSDYSDVAEILVDATKQYRADDTAIVFIGHGTEHQSGAIYTKLQDVLTTKGYNDYVIGTVEHSIESDHVREILAGMNVSKVILRPLMVVAGDHANNDMAGDEEDSWKTILTEDGYTVETVIEGLGQVKGIQDIYIKHIQDAINSSNLVAEAPAANAVGVTANRVKNGTYSIEVDSSTSMFKFVDCQLTVEDNTMTAEATLSGQGFGKLYFGTGEEATGESVDKHYEYADNGERHSFTFPVEALDKELECAGWSIRKEQWYDHIVVFKSANIPGDAFLPCQIDVEMSGGSGRATIQSPTTLIYQDGTDYAQIIWSSSNYTYMTVDDEKYLPVNTDGNSTFEIPVVLDRDMAIIACTVAMSEPKEIEYTLRFDSSSIK